MNTEKHGKMTEDQRERLLNELFDRRVLLTDREYAAADKIKELEAQIMMLQDDLADRDFNLLAQFDPAAAEATDLYTWIKSKLCQIELLRRENRKLLDGKPKETYNLLMSGEK